MEFFLHATIHEDGKTLDYYIYEVKLLPGKYRAELQSISNKKPLKKVIFWKEKNGWKAMRESQSKIAEMLGKQIDGMTK